VKARVHRRPRRASRETAFAQVLFVSGGAFRRLERERAAPASPRFDGASSTRVEDRPSASDVVHGATRVEERTASPAGFI